MTTSTPDVPYPRFAWPRSGWWFTVLGALAGIAVVLYPDISNLSLPRRFGIAAGLIVLPLILVTSGFIVRIALAFYRRAIRFENLAAQIIGLEEKLASTQYAVGNLLRERHNRNAYPIAYCYTYESRAFIALRKKRGRTLSEGHKITVFDTQTASIMGHFTVARQDNDHYLCERKGFMDALWLGNIRQHGSQHSEAPPEALAIAMSATAAGDEDE